jgi:hypothetical protein
VFDELAFARETAKIAYGRKGAKKKERVAFVPPKGRALRSMIRSV